MNLSLLWGKENLLQWCLNMDLSKFLSCLSWPNWFELPLEYFNKVLFVTEMLLLIGLRTWNRNVVSIDDYASCFDNIDPLLPYKKWTTKQVAYQSSSAKKMDIRDEICSQRVQAVFIVSDSVDWSRDIQVSVTSSFLDYRTQTIHLAEGKVFVIHLTRQKQKKKRVNMYASYKRGRDSLEKMVL